MALLTTIFGAFYYYENYVVQPENPIEVNTVGSAFYEQAKLHRAKGESDKEFEALLKANDDDYAPARAALAETYLHGIGTVKNPDFAKVTAQSALDLGLVEMSENNDEDALYQLALFHRDGLVVEKSLEKYKNFMTKAAALGHSRAAHYLGKMLYKHENEEDRCRGLEFTDQATKKGQVEAAHWLGWYYKEGKCGSPDLVKAVEAFKIGANGGNSGSQLDLGYLYETGQGVPNPSISDAEKWYLKAANQGSAQAQFNLGSGLIESTI